MTAYWELLKDPRWQQMRLRVMERDLFSCVQCGDTEKTLNVHHTYYAKNRKPWEYEPESLRTLCEDCHSTVSKDLDTAKRLLGALSLGGLQEAIGYLRAKQWLETFSEAGIPVESRDQANGLFEAFGIIGDLQDSIYERIVRNGGRAYNAHAWMDVGSEQVRHLRAFYERNKLEAAQKKPEESNGSNPDS